MHSSRMHTVRCSGHRGLFVRGCVPWGCLPRGRRCLPGEVGGGHRGRGCLSRGCLGRRVCIPACIGGVYLTMHCAMGECGRHPLRRTLPGQTLPLAQCMHPRPVHAGIHTPPAQCMLGYTHTPVDIILDTRL